MNDASASVALDFKELQVVSISRQTRPGLLWVPDEWYTEVLLKTSAGPNLDCIRMPCNVMEHERLVKQFEEYKAGKR